MRAARGCWEIEDPTTDRVSGTLIARSIRAELVTNTKKKPLAIESPEALFYNKNCEHQFTKTIKPTNLNLMNEIKIVLNASPKSNPETFFRAIDQITERIDRHFADRVRELLYPTTPKNTFDKCKNCVWFHKTAKFCAVAPQNLTSLECGDRQLPEPNTDLTHLEARSPERIALVQELVENLEISADVLERNLYQGCVKHPGAFGLTTRGLLNEIETYGGYSIAQMELIGDGIRLNGDMVSGMVAGAIRKKILAGRTFTEIMGWLLSTINA